MDKEVQFTAFYGKTQEFVVVGQICESRNGLEKFKFTAHMATDRKNGLPILYTRLKSH